MLPSRVGIRLQPAVLGLISTLTLRFLMPWQLADWFARVAEKQCLLSVAMRAS